MEPVASDLASVHPAPVPSDTFRRLIELADNIQRETGASDGAMAERCGLMRESYLRARRKARIGKGDVETMTEQRIAVGLGLRVGLLSGDPDPFVAALVDAVDALRRAEEAAVAAGDERAAILVRPALGVVGRLAAEKGGTS